MHVCVYFSLGQYLHPFEAAKYRNAARSVRAIGRDCIKRRIQSIESGEQVPNDILTHILQLSCEYIAGNLHNYGTNDFFCYYDCAISATKESVDIEELVDDFVTFYIAGQETTASMLTFALVLTLLHPNVLER